MRKELMRRVERVVKAGIGYRSASEFIAEAVRLRLAEVEPLLEKLPRPQPAPPAGVSAEQRGAIPGDEPGSSRVKSEGGGEE